jgi:hypothetical protein
MPFLSPSGITWEPTDFMAGDQVPAFYVLSQLEGSQHSTYPQAPHWLAKLDEVGLVLRDAQTGTSRDFTFLLTHRQLTMDSLFKINLFGAPPCGKKWPLPHFPLISLVFPLPSISVLETIAGTLSNQLICTVFPTIPYHLSKWTYTRQGIKAPPTRGTGPIIELFINSSGENGRRYTYTPCTLLHHWKQLTCAIKLGTLRQMNG